MRGDQYPSLTPKGTRMITKNNKRETTTPKINSLESLDCNKNFMAPHDNFSSSFKHKLCLHFSSLSLSFFFVVFFEYSSFLLQKKILSAEKF